MTRKDFFIRITGLIFVIFFINYLAMTFHWYSSIWWFDMPMHFLGGLWVGILFIWIFYGKKLDFSLIFKIIISVFLIGIFWEIFEIVVNNFTLADPFNLLDTISDVCFDVAGGAFAIWYFYYISRKTIFRTENTV